MKLRTINDEYAAQLQQNEKKLETLKTKLKNLIRDKNLIIGSLEEELATLKAQKFRKLKKR